MLETEKGCNWTCVECGSTEGFTHVVYDTPGEPCDYDVKCNACESTDVRESRKEALHAMALRIDELKAQLDEVKNEKGRVTVTATRNPDCKDTLSFDGTIFTTVRACKDCGVLICGGPIRCLYCGNKQTTKQFTDVPLLYGGDWTWQRVALRVGEDIARNSPKGYYDLSPVQWQDLILNRLYAWEIDEACLRKQLSEEITARTKLSLDVIKAEEERDSALARLKEVEKLFTPKNELKPLCDCSKKVDIGHTLQCKAPRQVK